MNKMSKLIVAMPSIVQENFNALLLVFAAILALIFANIAPLSVWYKWFITLPIGFRLGDISVTEPIKFWVNDVLLTLFFFIIGLEMKQETIVGGLKDYKQATFIIACAVGGVLLPIGFYLIFNYGSQAQSGWGVSMVTDTAFVVGLLGFFKKLLPKETFKFLMVLAIIDDIIAVAVIAIFYSANIHLDFLGVSLFILLILCAFNFLGIRQMSLYFIVAFFLWLAIEKSGIHTSISGMIVALLIPVTPKVSAKNFSKRTDQLLKRFDKYHCEDSFSFENKQQQLILENLKKETKNASSLLEKFERLLESPVYFIVLPLFIFINSGISINFDMVNYLLIKPIAIGIILALVIGKPFGIWLFGKASLWLKVGKTPDNLSFQHITIISFFAGIGFTMSLFIAELNFANQSTMLAQAKLGVIIGSIVSTLLGVFLLYYNSQQLKRKVSNEY